MCVKGFRDWAKIIGVKVKGGVAQQQVVAAVGGAIILFWVGLACIAIP